MHACWPDADSEVSLNIFLPKAACALSVESTLPTGLMFSEPLPPQPVNPLKAANMRNDSHVLCGKQFSDEIRMRFQKAAGQEKQAGRFARRSVIWATIVCTSYMAILL